MASKNAGRGRVATKENTVATTATVFAPRYVWQTPATTLKKGRPNGPADARQGPWYDYLWCDPFGAKPIIGVKLPEKPPLRNFARAAPIRFSRLPEGDCGGLGAALRMDPISAFHPSSARATVSACEAGAVLRGGAPLLGSMRRRPIGRPARVRLRTVRRRTHAQHMAAHSRL